MIEIALATFWLFYASIVCLFLINLQFCRRFDSSRLFRGVSIALSFIVLCVSIISKLKTSEFSTGLQVITATAALGFILSMKFLELSVGYDWAYTQRIPLKLTLMYLLAFPRMPASVTTLSCPPAHNVRRECIDSISQGIAEYFVFRALLRWIPREWLTLPSSSFLLLTRSARYGLLCILLYLLLTCFLNVIFGLTGLVMNLPMHRMFPAFPFTSTSLRDFWSYRWNHYIKSSLHRISFVVLPKLLGPLVTVNRKASGLFASALSGLFHEYIYWFITNQWCGKNLIFFILHGLLVRLEIAVKLPIKPTTTSSIVVGWAWAIGAVLITSPLFFDPWIDIGLFADMK